MVGCHHRLDGHEFEQALGVGDGQQGLVCFSPWGCKESDMTERLMFYENGSIVKLNNVPKVHKWQHHDLNKGLNRPRVCDTEWNKSEKQKESESYINVCMWNLEKWYQWTYLQGRNRDIGFPGSSVVKNPLANAGDASSILGSGRSPGEGNGNPLQYSYLGNPMDLGVQDATVHGVTKESDN